MYACKNKLVIPMNPWMVSAFVLTASFHRFTKSSGMSFASGSRSRLKHWEQHFFNSCIGLCAIQSKQTAEQLVASWTHPEELDAHCRSLEQLPLPGLLDMRYEPEISKGNHIHPPKNHGAYRYSVIFWFSTPPYHSWHHSLVGVKNQETRNHICYHDRYFGGTQGWPISGQTHTHNYIYV